MKKKGGNKVALNVMYIKLLRYPLKRVFYKVSFKSCHRSVPMNHFLLFGTEVLLFWMNLLTCLYYHRVSRYP